jgi:cellobiose-specific phosphotransferase system component IIA
MSTGIIKITYDAKNDLTVAVKNDTKAEISNLYEKLAQASRHLRQGKNYQL